MVGRIGDLGAGADAGDFVRTHPAGGVWHAARSTLYAVEGIAAYLAGVGEFAPLFGAVLFAALTAEFRSLESLGRFVRLRQQIDELLYAEIAERRQRIAKQPTERSEPPDQPSAPTDILSLLIAARDSEGQPLSDQELRDQLMTLLLLGHETTASGLTWAFYWIYQNPAVLLCLRSELEHLPTDIDPVQLSQQPYLTAVCKEALRVYPIALISQPRKVKQTIKLKGYEFEPGTVLVPCIYLAHRRTQTYPEADQFRPERFLNCKLSLYEYFPFGGGNRSCIGMALALFEMKLILATLMRYYQFTPTRPIQPIHRPARRGITFVPPGNLQLRVTAKQTLSAAEQDSHVLTPDS